MLVILLQSSKKVQAGHSKSWNSSYNRYVQLSLFLWFRLWKLSLCPSKFEFNHIHKLSLQRIGGRHYKEIIDDLKTRKILIENPHYMYVTSHASPEAKSYTKSYVIHHKLRGLLEKQGIETVEIEVRRLCERRARRAF